MDCKIKSESENTLWLEANTKQCLKCKKSIEKNGGCNYMKCYACKYEFCWVCMNDWVKYHKDHFVCNKFEEIKNTE